MIGPMSLGYVNVSISESWQHASSDGESSFTVQVHSQRVGPQIIQADYRQEMLVAMAKHKFNHQPRRDS